MLAKAVSAWDKVIEITPFDIDVYFSMGVAYARKGMFAKAIDIFRKGMFYESVSVWRKALELNPDMLDARFNLGVVYSENEMHREAIHEFKQVLMSRLEDIETLVSLGLAYKNGGTG